MSKLNTIMQSKEAQERADKAVNAYIKERRATAKAEAYEDAYRDRTLNAHADKVAVNTMQILDAKVQEAWKEYEAVTQGKYTSAGEYGIKWRTSDVIMHVAYQEGDEPIKIKVEADEVEPFLSRFIKHVHDGVTGMHRLIGQDGKAYPVTQSTINEVVTEVAAAILTHRGQEAAWEKHGLGQGNAYEREQYISARNELESLRRDTEYAKAA